MQYFYCISARLHLTLEQPAVMSAILEGTLDFSEESIGKEVCVERDSLPCVVLVHRTRFDFKTNRRIMTC